MGREMRVGVGWCALLALSVAGFSTRAVAAGNAYKAAVTKSIILQAGGDWCDTETAYNRSRLSTRGQTDCPTGFAPDVPATRNAAIPNASTPLKTIRLRFHVVANNDSSNPAAPPAEITATVAQMNSDYASARINFVFTQHVVPQTQYRSIPHPDNNAAPLNALKAAYAESPNTQLNIFVTNIQPKDSTKPNILLLGQATLPWEEDALQASGGIVMNTKASGAVGANTKTLTHEVGHCLGLYHIHRGVSDKVSCSDCWYEKAGRTAAQGEVTGDLCSDTQPAPAITSGVCADPVDDPTTPGVDESKDPCSGNSWGVTPNTNYMGYGADTCTNNFTPQQQGRMHAWITSALASWLKPSTIVVTPVDLRFKWDYDQSGTKTQDFKITNTGGGTVSWTVSILPPWGGYPSWVTSVSPSSGTTTNETDTITVTATRPNDNIINYINHDIIIKISDPNASNPDAYVIAHLDAGKDYVYTGLAATCTGDGCEGFTPGDPNDWNDKANWAMASGGPADGVPGPDDRATINGFTVYVPTVTVKALRLTSANLATVNDAEHTITVTDSFEWEAGDISDCTIKLGSKCQGTISGIGPKEIQSRIVNAGTLECSGANIGTHDDNSRITNEVGGIFKIRTAMQLAQDFVNEGTLQINIVSGADPATISGIFSNSAANVNAVSPVVDVIAGQLDINALGSNQTGTFRAAAGTTLQLRNNFLTANFATTTKFIGVGTMILNGDFSAQVANLTGTLTAGDATTPGTLTIMGGQKASSNVNLKTVGAGRIEIGTPVSGGGGTLIVGDTWTIPSGSVVNFIDQANNTMEFGATQLLNQGTVNMRNNGVQFSGANNTFNNSGTLNIEMDVERAIQRTGVESTTLNNTGTINKNNTNLNDISGIRVVNNGTINAKAGILRLIGGAVSSLAGTINNSAGAFVDIAADEAVLNGTVINGPGRVRTTAGVVRLTGTVTANGTNSFELQTNSWLTSAAGGKMAGTGWLWSTGSMGGLGRITGTPVASTITLDTGAVLNINGTDRKDFNGDTVNYGAVTFVNNGTVNWSQGTIFANGTVAFNNAGTFNASNIDTTDLSGISFEGGEDTIAFNNSGLFNKSGAGIVNLNLPFKTTNRVNSLKGILNLTGGTSSGIFNADPGAFIDLVGSHILGNAPIQLFKLGNTTFTGAGRTRVIGNARQDGNLTAGTTADGGTLELAGNFIASGSKTTTITGPGLRWTTGSITDFSTAVPGFVNIASGGTLTIEGADLKATDAVIRNAGIVNWSGAKVTLAADAIGFDNLDTGTFNANSTSSIAGQFRNAGTVNIGTTTTARRFTLDGPYTQTATGRINFKIGGDNAATQFDQLVVNSAELRLAGAVGVTMLNNYNPPVGAKFLLINHTSYPATIGTFSGLAQGSTFVAGGQAFVADYTNGFTLGNLPLLGISGPAAAITEGNSGSVNATFTITLNKASTQQITVTYATINGTATAGDDFTATSGTLTFAAGQTSKTILVPVLGDLLDEGNETFSLSLSAPVNAVLPTTVTASATITDDDAAPALTVSSPRALNEGSAAAPGSTTFGIRLSSPSNQTVTVGYQTADGLVNGAVAGQDYVATNGTVTFAPGQMLKTVTVRFIGEAVAELNETFFLDIKTPTNATIASSRGKAFIGNDDGPSISIDNAVSVTEGNSGTRVQNFVVKLSAASTNTVTVNWATGNGPSTGGAGPADFTVATGTLTFAPGETSKTIAIQVKGDTTVEPNEKYFVNLTRPTFAIIADSQGSGFILNDDTSAGLVAGDEPSS